MLVVQDVHSMYTTYTILCTLHYNVLVGMLVSKVDAVCLPSPLLPNLVSSANRAATTSTGKRANASGVLEALPTCRVL